jgi:hypothetical protein
MVDPNSRRGRSQGFSLNNSVATSSRRGLNPPYQTRTRSRVGLACKTHLPTLSRMDQMPRPPETFFEGTPPHVRAYIEQLHATLADLHTRIAELETRQAKNSTNSSLPPSSEHPHAKPCRHTPKSPRRSGGQPGHAKHQRPLLPHRAMPARHPLCAADLPPLRCTPERHRGRPSTRLERGLEQ